MASADRAIGFGRGFNAERDKLRQQHIEDDRLAEQQTELEHARSRRAVTEQQQDTSYRQSQEELPLRRKSLETQVAAGEESLANVRQRNKFDTEDRPAQVKQRDLTLKQTEGAVADQETARSEKHRAMVKQAEQEGVGLLANAIDQGIDPRQIESRFNSTGTAWKIKPGTLVVDDKTKIVTFQGAGGAPFKGTTAQMRALLGGGGGKPALIKGTKDTVFFDEKGNRVAGAQLDKGEGPGSRKISPFNPEGYASDAASTVTKFFAGKYDPKIGMYNFDQKTRDKANYAIGVSGQLARQLSMMENKKGERISATEIGQIASEVASDIPTMEDAKNAATLKLGKGATSAAIESESQKIVRNAKITAKQKLDDWLEQAQAQLAAADEEDGSGGPPANGRPPLSSFQGQ